MSDVGKIVMCITLQGNKFLTVGTAYEVEQDVAFHYTVKNDRGVSTRYSKECFEEIPKETEKQKIKVLCVDLANYSYIIKGKLYEAEDYNTNYYQLVNDEGDVSLYRKTCFVTSNEATPIKPPLGLIPRKIYWEGYHALYCATTAVKASTSVLQPDSSLQQATSPKRAFVRAEGL